MCRADSPPPSPRLTWQVEDMAPHNHTFPPRKIACTECGGLTDYHDDVPEESVCCDQCCCELAGCCDACGGDCQGKAWPDLSSLHPIFRRL